MPSVLLINIEAISGMI